MRPKRDKKSRFPKELGRQRADACRLSLEHLNAYADKARARMHHQRGRYLVEQHLFGIGERIAQGGQQLLRLFGRAAVHHRKTIARRAGCIFLRGGERLFQRRLAAVGLGYRGVFPLFVA